MTSPKLAGTLVLALLSLVQGGAIAQPGRNNGNGNGNGNGNNSRCGDGDQGCEREQMRNNRSQDNNRRQPQGMFRPSDNHNNGERGAGPRHSFYRGDRIPSEYRSHQYVVDDWRGHGLRAPPRGYHWVQTGGDYVLVAIATGLILELLLNR
jgi:Ni/Co efflux regulator RcnB